MRFDKDRDVHGPVPVAVALERKVKDKDQRVVVVGGSSFLSNQFVGLLSTWTSAPTCSTGWLRTRTSSPCNPGLGSTAS